MESKGKYKTKQKEMVLDLFRNNPGRHFTASEICKSLDVGQATVYRKLEDLVSEGYLEKFITDPTSPACFELSEHEGHREHCHHMRCTECGSLIHLQCEELDDITRHLLAEHGFEIDMHRTVFYGLCEECRGKKS